MKYRSVILFLLFVLPTLFLRAAEPLRLENRREIFVDRYLIDSMEGAALKLHEPRYEGPVMTFKEPWEGVTSHYVTVLYDDGLYRMYYAGGGNEAGIQTTCYAESRNGIDWEKPNLGLYEILGTRNNNVILFGDDELTHNFAPFIDKNPDAPKEEKYKALAGGIQEGIFAFVSADGVHWKKKWDHAVFTQPVSSFDSLNCPFWSESERKYLFYYRTYRFEPTLGCEIRSVSRAESSDFENWEPYSGGEMSFGDTLREHLYVNHTMPYYRAPHIYLSTAARLIPTRHVLTKEERANLNLKKDVFFNGCSEPVLLSTRGGYVFDRTFMEALIRPRLDIGDWVPRGNYPARGVVPTGIVREIPEKPQRQYGELGESEMSMYVRHWYGQEDHALCRYSVRLDGFSSINAPFAGGEWTSKPFTFKGSTLILNASTSAEGWMQIEFLDEDGVPIPGFTFDDSPLLTGNWLAKPVEWESEKSAAELEGKTVRLHFIMRDADLYSVQFK